MKVNISNLRAIASKHPLGCIMFAAIAVRLLAVIFAKGFMASDDYFVYLHIPWLWAHGVNRWFEMDHPSGFSIIYPGANYLFFCAVRLVGLENPDVVMSLNRALHAAWSLVGVYYAYKLALLIAGESNEGRRAAFLAGLLAALLGFLPYGSVRNMPEMVCLPFVMMALYYGERALHASHSVGWRNALFAGVAIGAAFIVRYQALAFGVPFVFIFLMKRQWKPAAAFAVGALLMALVQGVTDQIAYGKFFGAPIQYFFYNAEHSSEYVIGPWWRYAVLLIGVFIPPFSIYFLGATFKTVKKAPIAFWGTMFFLVVHSLLPAKQERFIIPALMPLCVLGCCGLMFLRDSRPWQWTNRFARPLWIWFWIGNAILLVFFTFHYGKRGQIESLLYLYHHGDAQYVLIDRTDDDTWLPCLYLNEPEDHFVWIGNDSDWKGFSDYRANGGAIPHYLLILSPHNLQAHVQAFAQHGMKLSMCEHFGPGPLEWLLWKANPKFNSPNDVYVMRVEYE